MTTSDYISLFTAWIAMLALGVSIWAVCHQVRKSWLCSSAQLVTSLIDKFNTEDWGEKRRVKLIKILTLPHDDPEFSLMPHYGHGILGFYEHLGLLVKQGALDRMMVHNKFAWELICYYQLITQEKKNLLKEVRDEQGDATQYMEFEWLNKELIALYRKLDTEPLGSDGRIRWMNKFIHQESSLLTND